MADTNKIITIEEAQTMQSGSFPGISGEAAKRCPTMSELSANNFTNTSTTRTYANNQCVVASDLGIITNYHYSISSAWTVYHNTGGANMFSARGSSQAPIEYADMLGRVLEIDDNDNIHSSFTASLSVTYVDGDVNIYVAPGQIWDIHANNRGTSAGGIRSARFYGVYNALATSDTVTVSQAANIMTPSSKTLSFRVSSPQKITSDGITTWLAGGITADTWEIYTSGSISHTGNQIGGASATTFTIPSSATWIRYVPQAANGNIQFDAQPATATDNRVATITAGYQGSGDDNPVTCSVDIDQYRAPYTTSTYTIDSYGVTPASIAANESGNTHLFTITGTCNVKDVQWKDGRNTVIYDGRYKGNSSGNDCFARLSGSSPTAHWTMYDLSSTGVSKNLTFTPEGVGSVYAYAIAQNTYSYPIVQDIILHMGTDEKYLSIIHEGTSSVEISVIPVSGETGSGAGYKVFTVSSNTAGWTVSTTSSWVTLTTNGNSVTAQTTQNDSQSSRTAKINVNYNGHIYAQYTLEQDGTTVPSFNGLTELYDLGNGWKVMYYTASKTTTQQCTFDNNVLCIVRGDQGGNTTFAFASDGYYKQIQCGTERHISWGESSKVYTVGQTVIGTTYDNIPITQFGISIGGGPGAITDASYAGISIA